MPNDRRTWRHKPDAEYRFWLDDPKGDGMMYFRSPEERDAAAARTISCYLDDCWDEEVEFVAAGEVTHVATQVNRTDCPEVLDEEGCDEEGEYWPAGIAYRCDYQLSPLQAANQADLERQMAEILEPDHTKGADQ